MINVQNFGMVRENQYWIEVDWLDIAKMNFLLPVDRLRETKTLIAFYHPKPAYSFHVLIVPKKTVQSLANLDANDSVFLADFIFHRTIIG